MNESSSGFDPVEELVDEFLERYRRGERPTVTEYSARASRTGRANSPLFPALIVIEELGSRSEAQGAGAGSGVPLPERLGDYLLLNPIGSGGMGIVYRAFDEKRGVSVALKTLKRADATAILRFKQEFRALADVSHPNLVALHELATDGPIWFFTMELDRGGRFPDLCAIGDRSANPGRGDDRVPGTAQPIITGRSRIGPGCHRRHRTLRPEAGRVGPRRTA